VKLTFRQWVKLGLAVLRPVDGLSVRPAGPGHWSLRARGERRRFRMRPHSTDFDVFFQVFVDRNLRLSDWPFFAALRRRHDAIVAAGKRPLIIDCGANVGFSTAYFRFLMPHAVVVALEPEPSNFRTLQENLLGMDAVALPAAVHNRAGSVAVFDAQAGDWGFRTRDGGGVAAMSVPDILALEACRDSEPLVVKIDIEGFEKELFADNTGWIDRFPLMIVELHDWMLPGEANSANFLRALAEAAPRDLLWRRENVFSVRCDLTAEQA
jgi:FkbM family methyltransferase